MKTLATALFLLLTFSFAPAFTSAQEKPGDKNWQEFTSSEGGFSVLMPEKPTPSVHGVETSKGRKESHSFSYSDEELTDYLVAFSKYREAKDRQIDYDEVFDNIQKGLLLAEEGTVRSKIALNLDGNPGREVMIEHANGSVKIHRFYFVGDYFYQLAVEVKNFVSRCDKTERFLNSFKLIAQK
ncbi:MAG TPA: hypothetical protein VGO50_09910 [Pyrinomonadaceae bacterium]|jgi:hypothetical protein|nr:hypothetical protein [Pyrinomonadaceae bacterium]